MERRGPQSPLPGLPHIVCPCIRRARARGYRTAVPPARKTNTATPKGRRALVGRRREPLSLPPAYQGRQFTCMASPQAPHMHKHVRCRSTSTGLQRQLCGSAYQNHPGQYIGHGTPPLIRRGRQHRLPALPVLWQRHRQTVTSSETMTSEGHISKQTPRIRAKSHPFRACTSRTTVCAPQRTSGPEQIRTQPSTKQALPSHGDPRSLAKQVSTKCVER